jgi:diguanylate cyclase (GGDEF)-like protein/PAS domain S-box-containing protein
MDSTIARSSGVLASVASTPVAPPSRPSSLSTYHLLAERVLKESNDYVNSILASIADAMILITPVGDIQMVNQAAADLLGYDQAELTGQPLHRILVNAKDQPINPPKNPSDLGQTDVGQAGVAQTDVEQADFIQWLHQGAVRDVARSLRTKTGDVIPVALSNMLRQDDQGNIQGIVCVARDLREQQQTVAALDQSEARNLAFLRAIPDLVLRISRTGIYQDVVPAEGFDDNVDRCLVGKHLSEVLKPDLAEQQLRLIEAAFCTGEIQVFEYTLWVQNALRYQEARIVSCGPDEVLMIVRDVTERRQAEDMNALLAAVVEHAVDAIAITDAETRIQYVNPAYEKLTGYTRAEVIGRTQSALLSDWPQGQTLYQQIWKTVAQGQIWQGDLPGQRKNQSRYQQEAVITPVHSPDGKITHYISVNRDITERKQAESALKRYQVLSQHARDIVLFTQMDGQIVEANDAAVEAYGYSRRELLKMKVHDLHESAADVAIDDQITHASEISLLYEAVHSRKDGGLFAVEVSVQGAVVGDETLLLSIIRDITNRKRVEEKLFHNAFHDSLTNLPNRALFLERLRHAVQKTQQGNYLFAVLFLDLDGFKVVNDSLGHLAGDQLLVAIAQRLTRCLKTGDTLARFGGDEFTILLENIQDLSQAIKIAERIQQELAHSFNLDGQDIFTATSIGIVLSTLDMPQPEDLLRSADTALYRAKALGGTRYVVFDAEMHSHALMRLRLETDLRRALAESDPRQTGTSPTDPHSEFLIYYQPIVSLKNLKIKGFEALLRWQHPERGIVSPGEFIPIAEETGLIVPIGWIALRNACRQMRVWQEQFPTSAHLTISVNLSVKQFAQPDLVAKIRQILHDTGLNPRSLKLEITESAIMENADSAAKMLQELQVLGVQLSLDDFGTGYSSLAYLHRLPIDTLKVDRSFISRIDADSEQLEIVRAIITLAWNLGMDIVAEGVETNKQLAQLRALRCEFGQGYLFSPPQNVQAATALLAADNAEMATATGYPS